jgi:outer membrane protein assembly factor BamA
MAKSIQNIAFLVLAACLIFVGCSVSRKVPKGKQLLVKNKILNLDDVGDYDPGINTIIKQTPNNKFLGLVKLRLQMWNIATGKKDSRFWYWVKETLGEEPVLLDTTISSESCRQISKFLFKEGFFNNTVTSQTYYLNKRKARVEYKIDAGRAFFVDTFSVSVVDKNVEYVVLPIIKKHKIQGRQYSYSKLEELRTDITTSFQEHGFFEFNKSYVRFKVDTTSSDFDVKLSLLVANPKTGKHEKFKLRSTYIFPDYSFTDESTPNDTDRFGNLSVVYGDKRNITPRFLYQNIFLDDKEYALSKYNLTYQRLTGVNVFSNVRINLEKVATDSLDAYIQLTPAPKHSFFIESSVESRVNTADNSRNINFGLSGNVSYAKRNAFKNGEFLLVSLSGGIEPFFLFDSISSSSNFFNTIQFGPSLSITYPRFLLPVSQSKFNKLQFPETKLSFSYNRLENTSILRETYSANLAYQWKEGKYKTHNIAPLDISLVDAQLSTAVKRRIQDFNNPFLLNSYTNQFILAHIYTFIYSKSITPKTLLSYRGKAEFAGVILRGLTQLNLGNFIENSNYAHYFLNEHELRLRVLGKRNQSWAFRFFGGLGVALNANPLLPFDRRFFAGGSVGLRAWRATTIGPGSYSPPFNEVYSNLNRLGDVKLEVNAEYRFKLAGPLSGALFVDAGNIWEREKQEDRPNAEFSGDFMKEVAIGVGAGIRFDFDFLVVRLDAGLKFRDPSLPSNERWIYQSKNNYNQMVDDYNLNKAENEPVANRYENNLNFNLGIGYPF